MFQKSSDIENSNFSTIGGAERLSPLSVELFLSQNTKAFRRCSVLSFRKLLLSKYFMDQMGVELSEFSVETVLSHSSEVFRRGTFLCFRNLLVWKGFVDKRVVSRLSVESALSPSTQTVCRGTLLCFRLFPVSNTFKDKKGSGVYPNFVSYMFCLTVPKRFVAEDICNSQNICFRKIFGIRKGAAHHDSPSSKFFVSFYWKKPFGEAFWIFKKLWYRKI